ncbi:endosome-associated-trafficking regulator 1 isoform X2 [Takifugu rubripes]|uniref:endosome-associated-trafficking regulator 1 isoform X2 n=1 Tax=Takifugu rubripes TaxID=31033 RepID=UPI0005D186C8|nr:endosome-associated-trafficking regulator 1 isoform X2 [Takifugu rubripes]|eukprot:XP_011613579.1 PREDICTED: serologically defined colon cancer antigen 3 isoform X2 [Takifugu rubripes]
MSKERSSKSFTIKDDEGLNPFSFKEFLRWKTLDHGPEQDQEFDAGGVACAADAGSHFLSDLSLVPQEEEETDSGRSHQVGADCTFSICTEEREEDETRFTAAGGDEFRRSRGGNEIIQLQEENMLLRTTIRELQKRLKVNEHKVLQLSEELLHKRHQEEEEAQHLESMVQSVEQNLHLMTKRAVRAESSVSRMKAELHQLQVEINCLRSENNTLKANESEVIMTMRHNAKVASQHLNKMADHARCSLRQLMGEAGTLHLVSQLLQSIDRISQLKPES